MYINDGFALVVVFLSLGVIVLSVSTRKQAVEAISRRTSAALVMAGVAMLATGVLSLKLVSEVISNNASNRILRQELQDQLLRIENSIVSLEDRQSEAEAKTLKKIERLDKARADDRHQERRNRAAHTVLGSEILWLKFLAARDNGATEYLRTYSGTYFIGPEIVSFTPCSWPGAPSTGTFWTIYSQPDDSRKAQFYQLVEGASEAPVPITFTGVLSPEGRYGHMGAAKHLFIVVDAQKRDKDSCEHPWHADLYEPDSWRRFNLRH